MKILDKNHFALVTGASSGIGLSIAIELAKRGVNLVIISNEIEKLKTISNEIKESYKVNCHFLNIDLTDKEAAKKVYAFCQLQSIRVSILVNNAGILLFSELYRADIKKLDSILYLHINTLTMMTRLFAQDMVQDKQGYILNVSSISAVMPYPGISVYGPTKSYVRMFSKAIRTELSIYNVKVSCLLPGATETGLYDPNRINITLAKKLGVMQTADYVANKAVVGLLGNKSEIIPGIMNKLIVYLLPLFPNILVKFLFKNTDLISKGNNALD